MMLSINAVPSLALAQLPCAYALAMRASPVALAQSTATNMAASFPTVVGSKPLGVVASVNTRSSPYSPGLTRGFAAQAAGAVPAPDAPPAAVPESATAAPGTVRKMGPQGESRLYDSGYVSPHPGMLKGSGGPSQHKGEEHGALEKESFMEHPAYDMRYLESIKPMHLPPKNLADRVGLAAVRLLRHSFDLATGYGPNMNEAKWLQRMIFLETVAGVPGMVAGMLRHLRSLRAMRRDQGWIHCLLEEAENERMHLLTFFELRQPSWLFRAMVIGAQGVFFNAYFIAYLLWPKACHSFVGYLEEEAVRTYTHALADIDSGKLWANTPAPRIAQGYWGLKPEATMRDLILAVRADEACHSHVNHTLKELAPTDANPFAMGRSQLP